MAAIRRVQSDDAGNVPAEQNSNSALQARIVALETELAEQRASFERELQERTGSLEAARASAEAASASKSEFLATMSHEIRTPIHGAMGMLDLLADTALNDEQRDYVHSARTAAESLLGIINDILDFSKIEAGKLTIEPTAVTLRQLVDEVVVALAPVAHEKRVEVLAHVDRSVPDALLLDPTRIRQILTNLYGNAIKFTSSGWVAIRVKSISDKRGTPWLRFEIRDTGIGIDPERQARLFDPFTQADGSTTRKYGGTGLGLAVCRRLVELMRGRIGLKSKPGAGSTFWFAVPLKLAPEAAAAPPPENARLEILLFDPNPSASAAIADAVTFAGATASPVGSIDELIAKAAEPAAPDTRRAILIGTGAELADAFAAIRQMRKTPSTRLLPISIATLKVGDYEMISRLGITQTLVKPVRNDQIADLLGELSGKAKERAPSQSAEAGATLRGEVLLVDDTASNRKIAMAALRKMGLTPDEACDGREAVAAVKAKHYDLVLMDMQMPIMSGLEATEEIRAMQGEKRHVPIVALTANALPEDRTACLAAGMDDYVSKPVRRQRLREVVERWLSEAERAHDDEAQTQTILRTGGLKNSGGRRGIFGVLQSFVSTLDERLSELVRALDEADFRGLSATAQALERDARPLGAARLTAVAQGLREACETGDYETADRYARRLPRVAKDTAEAMQAYLATPETGTETGSAVASRACAGA